MIDIDAWCAANDVPPIIDGPEVFDCGEADRDRFVGEWAQHTVPYVVAEFVALCVQARKALATLDPRGETALRMAFGFSGQERDIEAAAAELGVARDSIRKIEERAIRLLRHPSRWHWFAGWCDDHIAAHEHARQQRLRAEQVHEERCEASRLARLARATPVHEPLREELRPYFEATRHRNDFAAR